MCVGEPRRRHLYHRPACPAGLAALLCLDVWQWLSCLVSASARALLPTDAALLYEISLIASRTHRMPLAMRTRNITNG